MRVCPPLCVHGGEDPQDALSLQVIFRKRALELVALLREMTCNLRHSMHLRHPVVPNAPQRSINIGGIDTGFFCTNMYKSVCPLAPFFSRRAESHAQIPGHRDYGHRLWRTVCCNNPYAYGYGAQYVATIPMPMAMAHSMLQQSLCLWLWRTVCCNNSWTQGLLQHTVRHSHRHTATKPQAHCNKVIGTLQQRGRAILKTALACRAPAVATHTATQPQAHHNRAIGTLQYREERNFQDSFHEQSPVAEFPARIPKGFPEGEISPRIPRRETCFRGKSPIAGSTVACTAEKHTRRVTHQSFLGHGLVSMHDSFT